MFLINRKKLKEEMKRLKISAGQLIDSCELDASPIMFSLKLNGKSRFSEEQCAKLISFFGKEIIDI